MKITEYPSASEILPGHKFLVDGPDGTQTVSGSLVLENAGSGDGGGGTGNLTSDAYIVHRNTYRGTNLGDTYTDAQKEAVSSGSFEDIYVGDYWEINGVKWRVMDIDVFMNNDNTSHHLVIMPDTTIATKVYDTTGGLASHGYEGASIRSDATVKSIVENAFGSENIYTYKNYLSKTENSSGGVNSYNYTNCYIELPSIMYFFGGSFWSNSFYECVQGIYLDSFRALKFNQKLVGSDQDFYFSTINMNYFVNALNSSTHSVISSADAKTTKGIRPVFALK